MPPPCSNYKENNKCIKILGGNPKGIKESLGRPR
jgi:hypothetical protein